ncbi:MAG: hypothetical protein AAFQ07_13985 [Chloroflexota bacterium]
MNGLEEQFSPAIAFVSLNATDDAEGQSAYEQLTLPGHPSIVIFDAEGREVYRGFGTFEEDTLIEELQPLLE